MDYVEDEWQLHEGDHEAMDAGDGVSCGLLLLLLLAGPFAVAAAVPIITAWVAAHGAQIGAAAAVAAFRAWRRGQDPARAAAAKGAESSAVAALADLFRPGPNT